MKRTCLSCGGRMKSTTETRRYGSHINVVLDKVPVHRCPSCGEEEIEIPRIEELHAAIAGAIAQKPARLTPGEIRWLRTHLGYSSVDFASLMGVSPETVSRWERAEGGKQMGLPAERLLRVLALHKKPIDDYGLTEMGTEKDPATKPIRLVRNKQQWAASCSV